jgi:hypothetical protein
MVVIVTTELVVECLLLLWSNFTFLLPAYLLVAYDLYLDALVTLLAMLKSFSHHMCKEPFGFCLMTAYVESIGDMTFVCSSTIILVFAIIPVFTGKYVPVWQKLIVYIMLFALNLTMLIWNDNDTSLVGVCAVLLVMLSVGVFYMYGVGRKRLRRRLRYVDMPALASSMVLFVCAFIAYWVSQWHNMESWYGYVHSSWHTLGGLASFLWLYALRAYYGSVGDLLTESAYLISNGVTIRSLRRRVAFRRSH